MKNLFVSNCLPRPEASKKFTATTFRQCFVILSMCLIFAIQTKAQVTPSDCVQGCTSNDVQIQNSYLSNAAGVKLASTFVCPQSGSATVYLTLELTTGTPRVGVSIFANIKVLDANGNPTGSPIASLSECFGIALNQPTNKVTFQQPFNWSCTTAIALTDVFIAWGTGNKNFCTGSPFQCPATPSKCFQLPGGSFIAIETPIPQNKTVTQCSDQNGGTTSTFNLNNVTVTNSQNVTITWWDDFTGPATFSNQITTLSSYSTANNTVYAKITSNADNTVFTIATVTLVVNQKPNLTITNPAAVCSPNTVNLQAAAVTAGSTLPAGTALTYWTDAAATTAVATPTAVGSGTYYIKATTNTTPACSDIKAVVVTVNQTPANPQVNVVQPTCTVATGTVTVTSPLDVVGGVDYEYRNNGGTWQDGVSFTVAASAAYSIEVRNKNGLCISTGAASGAMGAQPQTPSVPTADVTQPTCSLATGTITVNNPDATITYTLTGPSPATTTQANTTGIFSGLAPGTYGLTATKNGCTSGSASKTVNPSLATPSFTVCLVQPTLCASTGSVTVNATGGSGFTYKLNANAPQASNVFSNLASGSVSSITVINGDGCSVTVNCANLVQSCPAPGARIASSPVVESSAAATTVKAYPNPFSDKVKFIVTAAESGEGNLEIYNMMGQKIKTIYSGHFNAGSQNFELSLPAKQVATLVYVLRIGGKQVTGKLVQNN